MVKGREAKTPVLAHPNARDALLTRQTLQGFHMNSEVVSCLFSSEKRFK